MTELENMRSGKLYDPADSELVRLRLRARTLTRAFNASAESELELRARLLAELFGGIGQRPEIEPPFHCDYGSNIYAGDRLFMNFGCVVLDPAEVHIGDDVFIGPYVQIATATHPVDPAERVRGTELARPIRIGSRVWLGAGAILCPGVTIGEGTTIGAGSLVVRDVPANVVAAGNPCRVVRRLG
jgi:maltose O-acetyltransferase